MSGLSILGTNKPNPSGCRCLTTRSNKAAKSSTSPLHQMRAGTRTKYVSRAFYSSDQNYLTTPLSSRSRYTCTYMLQLHTRPRVTSAHPLALGTPMYTSATSTPTGTPCGMPQARLCVVHDPGTTITSGNQGDGTADVVAIGKTS